MPDFIVHTIPGSPYARAVLAALEEKRASWRIGRLVPGDQKQEMHLARQPFGKMPVLEHDGFSLYETQAILRYLDRVLPHAALTPSEPQALARMDQVMNINDCYLFPGCANVIVFHRVIAPALFGSSPDEIAIEEAMPRARIVFSELSRLLREQPFFGGDRVSLTDLMVAPQLDMFSGTPEWPMLTTATANLVSWLSRMLARPSMQATTWERVSAVAEAA